MLHARTVSGATQSFLWDKGTPNYTLGNKATVTQLNEIPEYYRNTRIPVKNTGIPVKDPY